MGMEFFSLDQVALIIYRVYCNCLSKGSSEMKYQFNVFETLKLILLLISFTLIGCASPQYNYSALATDVSEPPLGNVVRVNVGDSMLLQGRFTEHDAIHVSNPGSFGLLSVYTVSTGYFFKQGEDEDFKFYLPLKSERESGTVKVSALADPFEVLAVDKEDNELCGVSVYGGYVCNDEITFIFVKKAILSENAFQQTLIYSGKSGSNILIGYREFSNNMARPAFNNDVSYDLDESTDIGYKGARLEILKATNQYIEYKVISNFNKAD